MNLNEQISRIREMMNLNEDRVNLTNYTDESNIIQDVKRIGGRKEGHPVTSMKINTFLPDANSNEQGQKVVIEVILEWEPTEGTKYGHFRNGKPVKEYTVKSILDVKSNIELDRQVISYLEKIFVPRSSPYDIVSKIYQPYSYKFGYDRVTLDKVFNNVKRDQKELENTLVGPEQQVEPEMKPHVPSNEKIYEGDYERDINKKTTII